MRKAGQCLSRGKGMRCFGLICLLMERGMRGWCMLDYLRREENRNEYLAKEVYGGRNGRWRGLVVMYGLTPS